MRGFGLSTSWRRCLGAMAGVLGLPLAAHAGSIDLGTYKLLADTPNQQVQVFVGGGDAIKGVTLSIFTGDGGPSVGGQIAAPEISAVDLFANGSIFSANNAGYTDNGPVSSDPSATESQVWKAATVTQSGTVNLGTSTTTSLLATLTVDTTGFKSGKFALVLDNPAAPTVFPAIGGGTMVPTVTDGWIQITPDSAPGVTAALIPEPASLGLLGLCIPALLLRRRRASERAVR